MKKTIAVAALLAVSFAAPALPVQAATADGVDTCLILPALKQECWERARDWAADGASNTAAAIRGAAGEARDANLPGWWNCTRAPAGSGHLFDCRTKR